jgi:hypothetical protein
MITFFSGPTLFIHVIAIFCIRYSHLLNRYNHTAMDQVKMKKIMKLTQMWIQDNKYSNHAKTITQAQWMDMLPKDPGTDIWKFEAKFVMTNDQGLVDLDQWKLVDIEKCHDHEYPAFGWHATTYRLTGTGTRSTQSLLEGRHMTMTT